jgi:hypothetical protein
MMGILSSKWMSMDISGGFMPVESFDTFDVQCSIDF